MERWVAAATICLAAGDSLELADIWKKAPCKT